MKTVIIGRICCQPCAEWAVKRYNRRSHVGSSKHMWLENICLLLAMELWEADLKAEGFGGRSLCLFQEPPPEAGAALRQQSGGVDGPQFTLGNRRFPCRPWGLARHDRRTSCWGRTQAEVSFEPMIAVIDTIKRRAEWTEVMMGLQSVNKKSRLHILREFGRWLLVFMSSGCGSVEKIKVSLWIEW